MMGLDEVIEYMTIPGFETGGSNWGGDWKITWETWRGGRKYGFAMKIHDATMKSDAFRRLELDRKRLWAKVYGQKILDRIA